MNTGPNKNRPADKPYASNLVGFLEDPVKYRPLEEFLNLTLPDEETVLTHCIKNQMVDAVDSLLTYGADPNLSSRKGVTPISAAAHKGNIVIMHRLIIAGAAVNAVNQSGSTALIQAAHFGHLPAVRLLLTHNAASDFANVKGTTALMRACQEGHLEISKCLLESDVEVNRKNHEGMNALMLASQRGHADIVLLLIKAGATMDEQTTQGSTALMLACKRGHGRCVETLVSMGAEICMKDRRGRTAKDTATRREHTALLQWLDTQVQVRKIQQSRHALRHHHLLAFRQASLSNVLVLNEVEAGVSELVDAVHRTRLEGMKLFINRHAVNDEQLIREFRTSSSSARLSFLARSPEDTLGVIQGTLASDRNPVIAGIPVYKRDIRLSLSHPGRADWMWSSLLNRCMSLPSGLFETIMEYLPMPRIWQWTLTRVKSRCKLSPHQALLDICTIMDEILCDANIFAGKDQTGLLMKINKSPQIHEYLVEHLGMSYNLVDSLCDAGDVQGTLVKHKESEITYKPIVAKQMLVTAVALYRWFRTQQSSVKMLGLILPSALNISGDHLNDLTSLRLNTSGVGAGGGDLLTQDDAADLMEETDAGGEGSEDIDEQDDDGDGEGEGGAAGGGGATGGAGGGDPETENDDMQVEGAEGDDNILDDSDVDESDNQMMIHGMI